MATRRDLILSTVTDAAADFLYYDRKAATEGLLLGDIQLALQAGEITIEEIVAAFEKEVRRHLG